MKKVFTLLLLSLTMSSCSSNDEGNELDESAQNPSTTSLILVSNAGLNQFIIYHLKANGNLHVYDYEDSITSVDVSEGDKIFVTCKIGENLLPTVSARFGNGSNADVKILYSSPNSTQYYGFRLMKTEGGSEYLTLE